VSGKRYNKRQVVPGRQGEAALARPDQHEASLLHQKIQTEFFSGPLPPPNVLARYNEVVTNGAERIMGMAERQSAHRESLESQIVAGNLANSKRGTLYGFIIAMVTIICGSVLIYTGHNDAYGLATILAPLAGLVTVFFYSAEKQKKERTEKAATLDERRRRS
jgi:uncharacterized membrane protein